MARTHRLTISHKYVAPAPALEIMIFQANGNIGFNNDEYVEIERQGGFSSFVGPPAAGDGYSVLLPIAGSFHSPQWQTQTPPSGTDWRVTLTVNGATTAGIITIADGTTVGVDTGWPIAAAAGDFIAWLFTSTDTSSMFANETLTIAFS